MRSKKKITIHDLAKELETTPATISRALNDHPRISEQMKERVKAAAQKHNYQPNIVASNFRKGKSKTVAVIIPSINREYFSNAIHSIENTLTNEDYSVMICQTSNSPEIERKQIETLINHKISGIIISSNKIETNKEALQKAIDNGIKIVQFDSLIEDLPTSRIRNNDFNASRATVLHMLEQGYRNIALFCGILTSNIYRDRKAGFIAAHEEFGAKHNPHLVFENTNNRCEGESAARHIIENNLNVDAIFSCGDYAVLGASLILKEAGYRIPEDIGLAGYANEPFTAFVTPSITSFDQHSQTIGELAAKQILNEIKNKNAEMLDTTVKGELILRESSKRKKLSFN